MKKNQPAFFKNPRWMFAILLTVFFLPLLLAWVMAAKDSPLSAKTTNHGQLLQPPLNLNTFNIHRMQQPMPAKANIWQGHWTLGYVAPLHCGPSCEKTIFYLHQIRTATGKDSERVQNAVLGFNDLPADAHLQEVLRKFPTTTLLTTSYQQYTRLLSKIPNSNFDQEHGNIFIVDPLGNLLLLYRETTAPMDIFVDLTHLLKFSQIG